MIITTIIIISSSSSSSGGAFRRYCGKLSGSISGPCPLWCGPATNAVFVGRTDGMRHGMCPGMATAAAGVQWQETWRHDADTQCWLPTRERTRKPTMPRVCFRQRRRAARTVDAAAGLALLVLHGELHRLLLEGCLLRPRLHLQGLGLPD